MNFQEETTHAYTVGATATTRRCLDHSLITLCLLWILYKHPGSSVKDICRYMEESVGTCQSFCSCDRHLEHLRGKGLVSRESAPHAENQTRKQGRPPRKVYNLTEQGETAILDGEWALKQVRGFSI